MKVKQKKRDDRKKQTAEIFTPSELVNEILEKLPEECWDENKTFCDPAAGNGNFLIEVYKWKVEKYKHDPTKALETIYGVELMSDNVAEMKLRLMKQAKEYGVNPKDIIRILRKNIVCHDALTYHFDFDDIFIEAKHTQNDKITHLKDLTNKWWTIDEIKQSINNGGHFNCRGVDVVIEDEILNKLPNEEI